MPPDVGNSLQNAEHQRQTHISLDAMPETIAQFEYQPLDAGEREIRLLKIISDRADQTIRCTLSAFHLETSVMDEHQTYETKRNLSTAPCSSEITQRYLALSYMWGAPEQVPTFHILVNGRKFEVRENLYHFLLDFREEKEDEYLWIDQICIDQGNLQERSAQVRIMGTIYANSAEVIVWLSDDSDKLQAAARRFGTDNVATNQRDELDPDMDALIVLLGNKYFTRLWIVQEVILARKVRVLIRGNIWASWEKMLDVFYHLHGLRGSINDCGIPPSGAWLLHHQNTKPPFRNLSTWIDAFGENECEDPRDKVYGLMAIVHPDNRLSIDYTKSVIEVYLDVIVVFWEYAVSWIGHAGIDMEQMKILLNLGRYMGLNEFQLGGLRTMLLSVPNPWSRWAAGVQKQVRVVKRVGYESAGACISRKGVSQQNVGAVVDRWWAEVDGKRQYHECRLFNPGKDAVLQGWGCLENASSFEKAIGDGKLKDEPATRNGSHMRPIEKLRSWTKLRRQRRA